MLKRHAIYAFILSVALSSAAAYAGELTIAWSATGDELTAGYRVYVGTEPGAYTRFVDVGKVVKAVISDLDDERTYYMAVRAYDRKGREASSFSAELVSLPHPRIDSIEPAALQPGSSIYVTLLGANFDRDMVVRSTDKRLTIRSAVQSGAGVAFVLVEASPAEAGAPAEAIRLEPSLLTMINPGRKADEYFKSHPEALDVDGDHRVDWNDLTIVQNAFGSRLGDKSYQRAADLDGDGTIDGRDLSRVTTKLATRAP